MYTKYQQSIKLKPPFNLREGEKGGSVNKRGSSSPCHLSSSSSVEGMEVRGELLGEGIGREYLTGAEERSTLHLKERIRGGQSWKEKRREKKTERKEKKRKEKKRKEKKEPEKGLVNGTALP